MNRGHEVGCPALRNGVPCACWISAIKVRTQRDSLGDVTHILGRPVRYWIDVDQQLKVHGYDRLLDGFMERIATLEEQNRALDIEWHGLQGLCDDQRSMIQRLREAIHLAARTADALFPPLSE